MILVWIKHYFDGYKMIIFLNLLFPLHLFSWYFIVRKNFSLSHICLFISTDSKVSYFIEWIIIHYYHYLFNSQIVLDLASGWASPLWFLCASWVPHQSPSALYCVVCCSATRRKLWEYLAHWRPSMNVVLTIVKIIASF